jgi:signal transduction histidine kinase
MSLRLRLLALILLILLPAAGLLVYTAMEARRAATARSRDSAVRLAVFASSAQRQQIDATRQLLAALAALPDVRERRSDGCTALVTHLHAQYPGYTNLGAITRAGDVFCSAVPQAGPTNVADRSYFWRAVSMRDFAMGDFVIGRITGKPAVPFALPAFGEGGEIQAVVFAAVDLEWLSRLMAEAHLPEHAMMLVLDRNGLVLARYPSNASEIGKPVDLSLRRVILGTREPRSIETPGPDGTPYLFAVTALQQRGGIAAYVTVGISKTVAFAEADRLLWRSLAILGTVAVLTLAIAWVGTHLVVRRVRALVLATGRLSAGDFSARSGLRHDGGELGQLAGAFDRMAESLQHAEERRALQEELQRKNYELEQRNLAIKEADRMKTEFVSMVSHELRTPLTSIQGYVELLLERKSAALGDEARESLAVVQRSAGRLLTLINDLLDLSRMEAGKIDLHRADVDLRAVIHSVTGSLRPLLEGRAQRLVLELDPDLPTTWADGDRLAQILTNLIANAHKYTPPGGTITVGARRDEAFVRVDIGDTGPGLTEEEQAQLFTRFFRARGAHTVAGSGLGLAITRLLVDLHDGRIAVSSAPGKGSTFSVWLPVSAPQTSS